MRADAFDYDLPEEQIAQQPTADREAARLMVVGREPGDAPEHRTIAELAELVPEGALVVLNDTRVIPARLLGHKAETGGKAEIFLVRKVGTRTVADKELEVWRALGKASKALKFGSVVDVGTLRVHL